MPSALILIHQYDSKFFAGVPRVENTCSEDVRPDIECFFGAQFGERRVYYKTIPSFGWILCVDVVRPYVHIATCVGNIACRLFSKYNHNDGTLSCPNLLPMNCSFFYRQAERGSQRECSQWRSCCVWRPDRGGSIQSGGS